MKKNEGYAQYMETVSLLTRLPHEMQAQCASYENESQKNSQIIRQTAQQEKEKLRRQQENAIAQYTNLREEASRYSPVALPAKTRPESTPLTWTDALTNQNQRAQKLGEILLQLKDDMRKAKEREKNAQARRERERLEALRKAKEEQERRERLAIEEEKRRALQRERQRIVFIAVGIVSVLVVGLLFILQKS